MDAKVVRAPGARRAGIRRSGAGQPVGAGAGPLPRGLLGHAHADGSSHSNPGRWAQAWEVTERDGAYGERWAG